MLLPAELPAELPTSAPGTDPSASDTADEVLVERVSELAGDSWEGTVEEGAVGRDIVEDTRSSEAQKGGKEEGDE